MSFYQHQKLNAATSWGINEGGEQCKNWTDDMWLLFQVLEGRKLSWLRAVALLNNIAQGKSPGRKFTFMG